MKTLREIDDNGYFIRDVEFKKIKTNAVVDKNTGEVIKEERWEYPEITDNYIEEPVPPGMWRPKWNGSQWIDEPTEYHIDKILYSERIKKIKEIKDAKKEAQLQPVEVRGILWTGGRSAAQKYDEAYRLSRMMDVGSCNFAANDGTMVEVDETFAEAIIVAVGAATYSAWEKAEMIIAKVNEAQTVEEIKGIAWTQ